MAAGQLLTVGLLVFAACKKDSFPNRHPLSDIRPATFYTTETDLQLYCNQYYKALPVWEGAGFRLYKE